MRYALAVVLVLATGLSGQEMMPGTARPLIKDLPPATSGFICPMHPNEVKATPGTCSICGMTLVPGDPMATADYALSVTTEPRAVKAGQKTKFRIVIRHPLTGEPVTQFAEVHDKLFHFFIVSRDMTQFFHEHPVLEKDGSFTIEHVIPTAGPVHAVQRLHAGRRRPADDREPARHRRLRRRHRLVVAEPQAGYVVREDRERRDGRSADRAVEGDRRRRSRRADSLRG